MGEHFRAHSPGIRVREAVPFNQMKDSTQFDTYILPSAFEKAEKGRVLLKLSNLMDKDTHANPIHMVEEKQKLNHLKDVARATLTRTNVNTDLLKHAEVKWDRVDHKPILHLSTGPNDDPQSTQLYIFEKPIDVTADNAETTEKNNMQVSMHLVSGNPTQSHQLELRYRKGARMEPDTLEPAVAQLEGRNVQTVQTQEKWELLSQFREKLSERGLSATMSNADIAMERLRELKVSDIGLYNTFLMHDINNVTVSAMYGQLVPVIIDGYKPGKKISEVSTAIMNLSLQSHKNPSVLSQVPALLKELGSLISIDEVHKKIFAPESYFQEEQKRAMDYYETASFLTQSQFTMMQYLQNPTPHNLRELTNGTRTIQAGEILKKYDFNVSESTLDFTLNPADSVILYAVASKIEPYSKDYTVQKKNQSIVFECPWEGDKVAARFERYAEPPPRRPPDLEKFDAGKAGEFSAGLFAGEIIAGATGRDIRARVRHGKLMISIAPL